MMKKIYKKYRVFRKKLARNNIVAFFQGGIENDVKDKIIMDGTSARIKNTSLPTRAFDKFGVCACVRVCVCVRVRVRPRRGNYCDYVSINSIYLCIE